MGVLDALSMLTSGAVRGYRGSQEIKRQLAEAKRKALLEERETTLKEQSAKLDETLKNVQIKSEALKLGQQEYGIERDKKSITEGGKPLKFSILGEDGTKQMIELPGNMETLTNDNTVDFINKLTGQRSSEKVAALTAGSRKDVANIGAGSRVDVANINATSRKDIESTRQDFRIKFQIGSGSIDNRKVRYLTAYRWNPYITEEENLANQAALVERFKQEDPEVFGIKPSGGSEGTTGKLSDEEARKRYEAFKNRKK